MSKVYESTHEEALARLCFVCGTIIKASVQYFDVKKNLDLVRSGLNKPEFSPVSGATPWYFCSKCHLNLRKLTEGKTIQTSMTLLNWPHCGTNCTTCSYLTKRKSSGGRPKKVKHGGGRPKDREWSLPLIPLVEEFRYSVDASVYSCNPGALLENLTCIYCQNIVVGPILLKCEHSSCRSCFVSHNFKKAIKETKCTKCDTYMESASDISASGLLQSCIDNLKVKCNNGSCNELVSLSSLELHKSSCNGLSSVRCASPLSDLTNAQCVQGVRITAAKSTPMGGKPKSAKKLVMNQVEVVYEKSENTEHESVASGSSSKARAVNVGVGTVHSKVCQVLHNSIPRDLVGREKELSVMKEFVSTSLLGSTPGSLYICGAPGTGKTASLTKVLDESTDLKAKIIFLNCMSLRNSSSIFSKLSSLIDSKSPSLTNAEGVKYLEKTITSTGKKILAVLDEIDQLESKDQEVLYKLFELPFLPKSRLILIGIANSLDFTDRVLPRLQTKSWCKPTLLQFQPYSKDEICAILRGRITEADNSGVVDQSAVTFCARKVSAMTGDARKALDILRRAVEIADSDGRKITEADVSTDKQPAKVTIGHVAKVCSDVFSTGLAPSNSKKTVFPLQQKIIICTLLACLKKSKMKEMTLSKLFAAYSGVCASRHVAPLSEGEFNGSCDLLDSQGIVATKKAKDVKNNKLTLRVQESELEHALQDKTLMVSILSSGLC